MVGESSGTLCVVGLPSWEVMEEERKKGLRLGPGIKRWSEPRGSSSQPSEIITVRLSP